MPRPRDRASAEGLLPRMESRPWACGSKVTYRYHPVGGKPINLGTDRDAAIRRVLDMNGQGPGHGTMLWLWEQWQNGKRYKKLTAGTQADYALAWKQIDRRMGRLQAASITPPMVARYVHIDRAESPRRADVEKTLLSNLFKHGIMLGVCTVNATLGVEPHGSEASDVMPETAALVAFLKWLDAGTPQRRVLAYAAEFASLAGSRQVEFLPLVWPRVDEAAGVIRTTRAKQRGRKRDVIVDALTITPRMAALLAKLRALDRDCLYLFPTEDGNQYTPRGFKTLWQRAVHAAIDAKIITPEQRFNFHSLRRYYATMHKVEHGDLPDMHGDKAVTARVYDATREVRRRSL